MNMKNYSQYESSWLYHSYEESGRIPTTIEKVMTCTHTHCCHVLLKEFSKKSCFTYQRDVEPTPIALNCNDYCVCF